MFQLSVECGIYARAARHRSLLHVLAASTCKHRCACCALPELPANHSVRKHGRGVSFLLPATSHLCWAGASVVHEDHPDCPLRFFSHSRCTRYSAGCNGRSHSIAPSDLGVEQLRYDRPRFCSCRLIKQRHKVTHCNCHVPPNNPSRSRLTMPRAVAYHIAGQTTKSFTASHVLICY